MQYARAGSESYTRVENPAMDFAPGTYYVSYPADKNHMASADVPVTIAAASTPTPPVPEPPVPPVPGVVYTQQSLVSNPGAGIAYTISLSGLFSEGAHVSTTPLSPGDGGYDALAQQATSDKFKPLAGYEVSVKGSYQGELTLSFSVGDAYNEKTLRIYHRRLDGTTEVLSSLVQKGIAQIKVSSLSPFLLAEPMTAPQPAPTPAPAPQPQRTPVPPAPTPSANSSATDNAPATYVQEKVSAAPTQAPPAKTTPSGLVQTGDSLMLVGGLAFGLMVFAAGVLLTCLRKIHARSK